MLCAILNGAGSAERRKSPPGTCSAEHTFLENDSGDLPRWCTTSISPMYQLAFDQAMWMVTSTFLVGLVLGFYYFP